MKKLALYAGAIFAVAVLFLGYEIFDISGFGINPENPGQIITNNLVKPSELSEVSKFRSGVGHDFGGRGEKCRSMKHYFVATESLKNEIDALKAGRKLVPNGKNDVTIYAPFDGTVTQFFKNPMQGQLIAITPDKNHGIVLMLDHVFTTKKGMHSGPIPFITFLGSKVKAGEPIAVINRDTDFDVELRVGGAPWSDKWSSYFTGLTDNAFSEWSAVKNLTRNDFIISKEYRDAHPLKCINSEHQRNTGQFVSPASATDSNENVILKPAVFANLDQIGKDPGKNAQMKNSPQEVNCDKAHLGAIRDSGQGKMKCRVANDGRIVWGPLN